MLVGGMPALTRCPGAGTNDSPSNTTRQNEADQQRWRHTHTDRSNTEAGNIIGVCPLKTPQLDMKVLYDCNEILDHIT
jgi:hypothetical protein